MNEILIIVDMQPRFRASKDKTTLFNVGREIRRAIEDDILIMFVEYEGGSRTHKTLIDLVRHYDKVEVVKKYDNDGSRAIQKALLALPLFPQTPDKFRVVGVNKSACVAQTITGLNRLYPDAEVIAIEDACNCGADCYSPAGCKRNCGWSAIHSLKNVVVLSAAA